MYALHPGARDELEATVRWYEAQAQGLGAEFLSVVQSALERIVECPALAAAWTSTRFEAGTIVRRAVLDRFPYLIVYSVEGRAVVVWAIAHGRRSDGYWVDRVAT